MYIAWKIGANLPVAPIRPISPTSTEAAMSQPRLVFVHDWLTGMRGGEKCLEPLCRLWPSARLHTLLHARGKVAPAIEHLQPKTSMLQRLPRVERYYRYLLPVMPWAANWKLEDCDLVLSFSHCVAKSARPPGGVPHLCYCFTPMRYAWHLRDSYFQSRFGRWVVERLLHRLRDWDRVTADRVTQFIAISETVRRRIRECYDRDSMVIAPPVDTEFYRPAAVRREDFFLCVSAFAPYKRIDLAMAACNRLRRRLVVIGDGQDKRRLQQLAGPTVTMLGWQPDNVIRDHLQRCRALLFPGEEDFGIVPVEALACATPVIALGRGGAMETVRGHGWLFDEQTVECLCSEIERFEREADRFDGNAARRQAERFTVARYIRQMQDVILANCK